jgi:hypothetical protein
MMKNLNSDSILKDGKSVNIKQKPIPNMACLVAACRELGIAYTFYDNHKNLVGVQLDREYFFANASTPFNDEAVGKICKDKEFMYRIASDSIRMPHLVGFIDPNCNAEYQSYVLFNTHEEIIDQIEKTFTYPLIVKMNSGSRGTNVFKCSDRSTVSKALKDIYDRASQYYDYVAVAQEYIKIKREFRVIVFRGKIILVYEKDFSRAGIPATGNISPLHQEASKALLINDQGLIERLFEFVSPMLDKLSVGFAGLDVALDEKDLLWLIELNSKPGFEYFVRDNGDSQLIEMYKQMLISLQGDFVRSR